MARTPNYGFEKRRKEEERKAKKEAKRESRRQRRAGTDPAEPEDADATGTPADEGDTPGTTTG